MFTVVILPTSLTCVVYFVVGSKTNANWDEHIMRVIMSVRLNLESFTKMITDSFTFEIHISSVVYTY